VQQVPQCWHSISRLCNAAVLSSIPHNTLQCWKSVSAILPDTAQCCNLISNTKQCSAMLESQAQYNSEYFAMLEVCLAILPDTAQCCNLISNTKQCSAMLKSQEQYNSEYFAMPEVCLSILPEPVQCCNAISNTTQYSAMLEVCSATTLETVQRCCEYAYPGCCGGFAAELSQHLAASAECAAPSQHLESCLCPDRQTAQDTCIDEG